MGGRFETMYDIWDEEARYVRAKPIIDDLKKHYSNGRLTFNQFRTLRGQAIAGDTEGALKGMAKLLRATK